MIRFLLDTNVISARSPRAIPDLQTSAWLDANVDAAAISVVTLAEIESGVAKLRREGATRKAVLFADWLNDLQLLFEDRILPLDIEAARIAGALQDKTRSVGRDPGFADVAIAATAFRHSLTLVTLNTRHFDALGIALVDPSRPDASP